MQKAFQDEKSVRRAPSVAQRRSALSVRHLREILQENQYADRPQKDPHSGEELCVRRVRTRVRSSFPADHPSETPLRQVHEILRDLQERILHERGATRSHEREARREGARLPLVQQIVPEQSHPGEASEDARPEFQAGEAPV